MARPKREIPWIEQRGGVWYAFWYDAAARETKRVSLRTRDSDEAQHRFAAFLVEGRAITHPGGHAQLTVSQALDDYWREHVALKCADAKRQENAIRYLKAFFSDTPIAEVDIPKSRAYAAARRTGFIGAKKGQGSRNGGKGSDSTIRRELTALVAAAGHAKRWNRIDRLPNVELPHERTIGRDDEVAFLSRAEIDLLIGAAGGELKHFVTLAYWTGARRASIEDLTVAQVKWDRHQVHLMPAGKKATKKRQPIVPILPEMEPSLRALCDVAAAEGRQRLFTKRDFYRDFVELAADLGIEAHPHLLRHSRATHMLQAGISIYDVARLIGDTVATIDRVYGHHSAESLAERLTNPKKPEAPKPGVDLAALHEMLGQMLKGAA